ncbi:hypothetical protein [Acinetobacter courvalinii]|nr:hypothetical protein [Acinetobacter courvalinii]
MMKRISQSRNLLIEATGLQVNISQAISLDVQNPTANKGDV